MQKRKELQEERTQNGEVFRERKLTVRPIALFRFPFISTTPLSLARIDSPFIDDSIQLTCISSALATTS